MVKSLVICGIILCSIIAIRASYQHYHCDTPWNRIEVTQSMWCEPGIEKENDDDVTNVDIIGYAHPSAELVAIYKESLQ